MLIPKRRVRWRGRKATHQSKVEGAVEENRLSGRWREGYGATRMRVEWWGDVPEHSSRGILVVLKRSCIVRRPTLDDEGLHVTGEARYI